MSGIHFFSQGMVFKNIPVTHTTEYIFFNDKVFCTITLIFADKMLPIKKRSGYKYVNRYTIHAGATKSYNNFIRCSFVSSVQFVPFKSVCLLFS